MHGCSPVEDLQGFAVSEQRDSVSVAVDRQRLPLPQLVQLVLALRGCSNLGHAEKLAWEYPIQVDGIACSVANQKFGLRIYVAATAPDCGAVASRLQAALIAGQRVVERMLLEPVIAEKAEAGNVTVRNQFHSLRQMYMYFRDRASDAFRGNGTIAAAEVLGIRFDLPQQKEGWWNTFAMVMAYFSLLEHVLLGCLPFAQFNPATESVKTFIDSTWADKFKRILNMHELAAMQLLQRLQTIANDFRNSYAHGGFDRSGATIAVHVPVIGAVPVALTGIRDRPQFELVPVDESNFQDICRVFDDCDQLLASSGMSDAMEWIQSGLDYRFDLAFRELLAGADDGIKSVIDGFAEQVDRLDNMDW